MSIYKRNKLKCIFSCFFLIINLSACSIMNEQTRNATYVELGTPLHAEYSEGIRAACPWDMIVWDGNLFIGGGDYDSNSGPVDIWSYDINNKVWKISGTVQEEEVNRFCLIGGNLIVPGIDPQEDWTLGNYYSFESGGWIKHRTIPGGLHNFDMVENNGKIFAGLGVLSGEYPIVSSSDGGNTFIPVKMQKNGEFLDTSKSENVRVYDLFVFNGYLFATFMYGDTDITYDLYRYDADSDIFSYDNQWYHKIHQIKFNNCIIGSKAEINDKLYFTTGYLYQTEDMKNFTRITFPHSPTVYDLYVGDNKLFVLCGEKTGDGHYKVSVWETTGQGTSDFEEVFHFSYDIPPISMACYENSFYIGMGDYNSNNEKNGMILQVEISK